MAQNFLYLFEFVVDDLFITRPNLCAPEEFPTCCEVSFRNSVYVSICDREFGQCLDPCMPKCGKCCLFSLESPITDCDKLLIHVYKKKTDKCKFLLGCADLKIKNLFDKVMENFNIENPNWQDVTIKHLKTLPNPKEPNKAQEIIDNDCDVLEEDRREQLCPTYELTKQLLPLFNLKGCQTGNLVLLIRLVANGPAIVSTFAFSRICNAGCDSKPPCNKPKKPACPCGPGRHGGGMDNAGGQDCGNDNDGPGTSKQYKNFVNPNNGCLSMTDPCDKTLIKPPCQRYFACNADKGYPCDEIEDECSRFTKCKKQNQKMTCCPQSDQSASCSCEEFMDDCEQGGYNGDINNDNNNGPGVVTCEPCSADTCDDCVKDPCSPCGTCMQPCFQTPRPPDPGPEAYDEFEACLNGSGLVIRVLKDTHQVETICDGTQDFKGDTGSDCDRACGGENINSSECSLSNMTQRNNYARTHIKRRTGGHIINHPDIPKVRANIKYSGNDTCNEGSYYVPYSKIKSYCDMQDNIVDDYRSHRARSSAGCDAICQPKHRKDEKSCCVQVNRNDIRNVMKGMEVDTRKKGIEVCYKTCEDTDSDVFLVKLGSKNKCERKRNNIEIELKTPKMPVTLPPRHVTTETQVTETELDDALLDACKDRKGKGKGKGKKK